MKNENNVFRTHKIIGIAMEVHREMEPGFLEAVYHERMEIEFDYKKIECVCPDQRTP